MPMIMTRTIYENNCFLLDDDVKLFLLDEAGNKAFGSTAKPDARRYSDVLLSKLFDKSSSLLSDFEYFDDLLSLRELE